MEKINIEICTSINDFQNTILSKFATRESNDIVIYFPDNIVDKVIPKSALFDISNTEHFDKATIESKKGTKWIKSTITKLAVHVHAGVPGIVYINRYDPHNNFFEPVMIPVMYREDVDRLENQLKLQIILNGGLLVSIYKDNEAKLVVVNVTPQKAGTETQKKSYVNVKVKELLNSLSATARLIASFGL